MRVFWFSFLSVLHNSEPHHEKTCFLHVRKQSADQLPGKRAADQGLCFCYIDSTIPLLP